MQLQQFINSLSSQTLPTHQNPLIAFCISSDREMPVLFAAWYRMLLKAKGVTVESLMVDQTQFSYLFSRLETGFLGMQITYWLRGVDAMEKKARQQLLSYVRTYQGPHQIVLFCAKDEAVTFFNAHSFVEIPDHIDAKLAQSLLLMFKKNNPAIEKQIISLIHERHTITLDQFCALLAYIPILGKTDDITTILDRVVESEHSLFALAQHFFAKQASSFYPLWKSMENRFPVTFWCVYWSEQLWRAYHAHYFLSKGQSAAAKIVAARLPFSYMQKDWKKSSLSELRNAHDWICQVDHDAKNTIEAVHGLDLFFNKFFLGAYTSDSA